MQASSTPAAADFTPPLNYRVQRIEAAHAWVPLNLRELWEYRELLYFLAWRDIRVRYKQTTLGITWALIQPLFTMVVFTVVFNRFGHMSSDGYPYPVFTFAALLPWQLFAFALGESSSSVVANQRLITKVFFPRLILPLAGICVGVADFLIALGLLGAMMIYYGIVPTVALLTLPIWVVLAVTTALAVGLWLAALNVRYRDIRYTVPFLTQLWLFATPVAYSSSVVPEKWRLLYSMNPMLAVVEGFRWALLGKTNSPNGMVFVSAAVVVLLLVGGLFFFRRTERTFADIV